MHGGCRPRWRRILVFAGKPGPPDSAFSTRWGNTPRFVALLPCLNGAARSAGRASFVPYACLPPLTQVRAGVGLLENCSGSRRAVRPCAPAPQPRACWLQHLSWSNLFDALANSGARAWPDRRGDRQFLPHIEPLLVISDRDGRSSAVEVMRTAFASRALRQRLSVPVIGRSTLQIFAFAVVYVEPRPIREPGVSAHCGRVHHSPHQIVREHRGSCCSFAPSATAAELRLMCSRESIARDLSAELSAHPPKSRRLHRQASLQLAPPEQESRASPCARTCHRAASRFRAT